MSYGQKTRILRKPEDRFRNLAGFPCEPKCFFVEDGFGSKLRMHWDMHLEKRFLP